MRNIVFVVLFALGAMFIAGCGEVNEDTNSTIIDNNNSGNTGEESETGEDTTRENETGEDTGEGGDEEGEGNTDNGNAGKGEEGIGNEDDEGNTTERNETGDNTTKGNETGDNENGNDNTGKTGENTSNKSNPLLEIIKDLYPFINATTSSNWEWYIGYNNISEENINKFMRESGWDCEDNEHYGSYCTISDDNIDGSMGSYKYYKNEYHADASFYFNDDTIPPYIDGHIVRIYWSRSFAGDITNELDAYTSNPLLSFNCDEYQCTKEDDNYSYELWYRYYDGYTHVTWRLESKEGFPFPNLLQILKNHSLYDDWQLSSDRGLYLKIEYNNVTRESLEKIVADGKANGWDCEKYYHEGSLSGGSCGGHTYGSGLLQFSIGEGDSYMMIHYYITAHEYQNIRWIDDVFSLIDGDLKELGLGRFGVVGITMANIDSYINRLGQLGFVCEYREYEYHEYNDYVCDSNKNGFDYGFYYGSGSYAYWGIDKKGQ